MMRKITAFVAATALAATAFAPVATARDYRGGGYDHHRGGHYSHRYYGYRRDNAVGVGVLGLVLGLAIGAAVSSDRGGRGDCYDPCRGNAPPPQYRGYDPGRGGPPPQSDQGYNDGSAYEEDYGVDPKLDGGPEASTQCMHQERQWDRYANRYVTVDVPC